MCLLSLASSDGASGFHFHSWSPPRGHGTTQSGPIFIAARTRKPSSIHCSVKCLFFSNSQVHLRTMNEGLKTELQERAQQANNTAQIQPSSPGDASYKVRSMCTVTCTYMYRASLQRGPTQVRTSSLGLLRRSSTRPT
jgi:hypothetical protein